MKVYVSGSYQYKDEIVQIVNKLMAEFPDFRCTSSWLTSALDENDLTKLQQQLCIDEDIHDVEMADALLLINTEDCSIPSPGRWIEVGLAMAFSKLVIVWGTAQHSMFLYDRNTIILGDEMADLILGFNAINKTFNVVKEEGNAHREDERGVEGGFTPGTEPHFDEDRSEGTREGIFARKGSPLSLAVRETGDRAEGTPQDETGAGE